MGEILLHWIESKLGLYLPHISDDARFRHSVSNGHLIGEILRKYNVISDDQCISLHKDFSNKNCLENMRNLYRWLSSGGLNVDIEDLVKIAEGQPGSALKFLYRLYLWLEAPRSQSLRAPGQSKCQVGAGIMAGPLETTRYPHHEGSASSNMDVLSRLEPPHHTDVTSLTDLQPPILVHVSPFGCNSDQQPDEDLYFNYKNSCRSKKKPNCKSDNSYENQKTDYMQYCAMEKRARDKSLKAKVIVNELLKDMEDYDNKDFSSNGYVPVEANQVMAEIMPSLSEERSAQHDKIYTVAHHQLACSLASRYEEEIALRVFLQTSRETTMVSLINQCHALKKLLTNHIKLENKKLLEVLGDMASMGVQEPTCRPEFEVDEDALVAEAQALQQCLVTAEAETFDNTVCDVANEFLDDLLNLACNILTYKRLHGKEPDESIIAQWKATKASVTEENAVDDRAKDNAIMSLADTVAVHAYIFGNQGWGEDLSTEEEGHKEDSEENMFAMEILVTTLLNDIQEPSDTDDTPTSNPEVAGIIALSGFTCQWEPAKVYEALNPVFGSALKVVDAVKLVELGIAAYRAAEAGRIEEETVAEMKRNVKNLYEGEDAGEFKVLWHQTTTKSTFVENQDGDPKGTQVENKLHPSVVNAPSEVNTQVQTQEQSLTEQEFHAAIMKKRAVEPTIAAPETGPGGDVYAKCRQDATTFDDLQILFSPDDCPEQWPVFVSLGKQALEQVLESCSVDPSTIAQLIAERMRHYAKDSVVLILNYPNGLSEALELENALTMADYETYPATVYSDILIESLRGTDIGQPPEITSLFEKKGRQYRTIDKCFVSSLAGLVVTPTLLEDGNPAFQDGRHMGFIKAVNHSFQQLRKFYNELKILFEQPDDGPVRYDLLKYTVAKILRSGPVKQEYLGEGDDYSARKALFGSRDYAWNPYENPEEWNEEDLPAICSDSAVETETDNTKTFWERLRSSRQRNSDCDPANEKSRDSVTEYVDRSGENKSGEVATKFAEQVHKMYAELPLEAKQELSEFWITMEKVYVRGLYEIMGMFREQMDRVTQYFASYRRYFAQSFALIGNWKHLLRQFICEFNGLNPIVRWDPEAKAILHCRIAELKLRLDAFCADEFQRLTLPTESFNSDEFLKLELEITAKLYTSLLRIETGRFNDTIRFLENLYVRFESEKLEILQLLNEERIFQADNMELDDPSGSVVGLNQSVAGQRISTSMKAMYPEKSTTTFRPSRKRTRSKKKSRTSKRSRLSARPLSEPNKTVHKVLTGEIPHQKKGLKTITSDLNYQSYENDIAVVDAKVETLTDVREKLFKTLEYVSQKLLTSITEVEKNLLRPVDPKLLCVRKPNQQGGGGAKDSSVKDDEPSTASGGKKKKKSKKGSKGKKNKSKSKSASKKKSKSKSGSKKKSKSKSSRKKNKSKPKGKKSTSKDKMQEEAQISSESEIEPSGKDKKSKKDSKKSKKGSKKRSKSKKKKGSKKSSKGKKRSKQKGRSKKKSKKGKSGSKKLKGKSKKRRTSAESVSSFDSSKKSPVRESASDDPVQRQVLRNKLWNSVIHDEVKRFHKKVSRILAKANTHLEDISNAMDTLASDLKTDAAAILERELSRIATISDYMAACVEIGIPVQTQPEMIELAASPFGVT